jgi:ribonucleotide reductase alpha subunit
MRSHLRLPESFLAPYRAKGDPFTSLLARSVYLGKYSRDGETWTDTVRRVVEGSMMLGPACEMAEAEALFEVIWTGQGYPPGRGFWTGGVPGIPSDAAFNCYGCEIRSIDDWCWTMNQLMCGGGVGVSLAQIPSLPPVVNARCDLRILCSAAHPNADEVKPDAAPHDGCLLGFVVPDDREGWVEALRRVLTAAWLGQPLAVDVSVVRPRGAPLKTFGGVASGPGPLVDLLRSVWRIVRGATGHKIRTVEALDITNLIGLCIKSGNVRRSALLAMAEADDHGFRDAKKDPAAILSHRHTSNNSIVLRTDEDVRSLDWHALVGDLVRFGEPGIINLALIHKTDPGVVVTNPCFVGETRLATQHGLVPIRELAERFGTLKVTTDDRVGEDYSVGEGRGTVVRDAVRAYQTSADEEVFEVTTRHGYRVRTTAAHKFVTPTGFVELCELRVGDALLLQSGEGQWGTAGTEGLGTVIGLIEGDGCFSDGRAYLRLWADKKPIAAKALGYMRELAEQMPARNGVAYPLSVHELSAHDAVEIASSRVARTLAEYGYREKGKVPEVVWRGTRACVRGYLRGLFATDGTINWSKEKQSCSARLAQANEGFLREVQQLLANFGIVSKLHWRKDAGMRAMPDGHGGSKEYACKALYELIVESANLARFGEVIGFLRPAMAERFAEWKASWKRGPYRESFDDEIVSIESAGRAPVYCTTQPSHHTVIANGVVTGQCSEIPTHHREACNLAEVFPANCADEAATVRALRLLTRYALRNRLQPLSDPIAHEVNRKNMRLGVALGGLCDFDWTADDLRRWYRVVRAEADAYADALGVPRPIAVSTCKPSGTISLMSGASPGMHAPYAPFYLRRTQIAANDPMAAALREAGVPCEPSVYDKTGRTLVFAFPTKAKHTRATVQTEGVRDQLERQRLLQTHWADNAVSATISFRESEIPDLPGLLAEYVPHLKSTSLLPAAHGYAQAPYEAIDEATYERLAATIDHAHPLTRGEGPEVDACSSGSCPIR